MTLNLDLLKKNQLQALNSSIDNDFQSGIHYHATGSGKSWIAMYILEAFYNKYPQGNVVWICERKDILEQQFSKETITNRGFKDIIKKYMPKARIEIINASGNKSRVTREKARTMWKEYIDIGWIPSKKDSQK